MRIVPIIASIASIALGIIGAGGAPASAVERATPAMHEVHYTIDVVEHTLTTVNYVTRGGFPTKIDFVGTPLAPGARGEAEVETKKGYTTIEVEYDDLPSPSVAGQDYLTYVLWAITPEGRATNLGEVVRRGSSHTSAKLNVTTELQSYGLMVTAEPYFAVSRPSNAVILENAVRKDTSGRLDAVDAKFELLERGSYHPDRALLATRRGASSPDLAQARLAVAIARGAGAAGYATETYDKADRLLSEAEALDGGPDAKAIAARAREAVQTAEDARLIAVKRAVEEKLALEREAAAAREAQAKAETAAEARLRDQAVAQADAERQAREVAEAERAAAEATAAAAERDKAELRDRLRVQLAKVLETRETARGLVVSIPNVLFDTDRADLKPQGRESLAKVAGITLTTPGLKIAVEGHADARGTDEHNQVLSERRAASVRDYLATQGIAADTITSRGFGESQPIADNATAAGMALNRRVELIVTGEAIGMAAIIP